MKIPNSLNGNYIPSGQGYYLLTNTETYFKSEIVGFEVYALQAGDVYIEVSI